MKKKFQRIFRYFLRRNISIYDLPHNAAEKSIKVMHLRSSDELAMIVFKRISIWMFFDENSGWGYNFLINELD